MVEKAVKNIGVLANCSKPSANVVLQKLADYAKKNALTLLACDPVRQHLSSAISCAEEDLAAKIDLLIVLGGDGTMLRAVRILADRPIPVLGVNLGSLGFLTSVAEDRLEYAMECIHTSNYSISLRTQAECRVWRGGKEVGAYCALNDVVIDRGASSRIITLDLLVDRQAVSSYICDGLIISTPTGSTGHALASGGPILHPETAAWIISAICPHTLSVRPLVIPDQRTITVQVVRCAGDLLLSVDGQIGVALQAGDEVRVQRSKSKAHFVQLPDHDYFSVLRQKLHWRGANFAVKSD